MPIVPASRPVAPVILAAIPGLLASIAFAAEVPVAAPVDSDWPDAWEQGFRERCRAVVERTAEPGGRYGTTYFESEKRAYGRAMLAVLGGFEADGIGFLQAEDAQADEWHRHTLGIDFFASFTLKHQVRKFFGFGDRLDPGYRERMREAARIWTERDPLRRPHPAFEGATGWGPDAHDSWVDIRDTDNLKLMRDTAVYLFAEETGNEATRLAYRRKLHDYLGGLYRYGMSEWDSENYLGHGIPPLLNLHDFAADPEVRRWAKAGLDFIAVTGALKYWRGNFGGPTKRDYNHPYPFGGSAASMLWMWFGDSPGIPDRFEFDECHLITSGYRPPAVAVRLARKELPGPVEVIAGKPGVAQWNAPDLAAPVYRETLWLSDHAVLGTLARGTQAPDVNGFTLLTWSSKRGADTLVAAPCSDPTRLGSPMYQDGLLAGPSAVAQDGNTAIWLTAGNPQPWLFTCPTDARLEEAGAATAIVGERTVVALWPINLTAPRPDEDLTARAREAIPEAWRDAVRILRADRRGPGHYGFAIEVLEAADDHARRRALDGIRDVAPDVSRLGEGAVVVRFSSGPHLGLHFGEDPEGVGIWRNGVRRNWSDPREQVLFGTLDEDTPPLVSLPWQGDQPLRVRLDGEVHEFPQP